MRHRLFHTLVVSSLTTLDGCALSHSDPPLPDPPDGTDSGPVFDAGVSFDGGPSMDVAFPDADFDAREPITDAGPDVFPADANHSDRFCEPGWPPTKGVRVCQVIDEEGVAVLRCTYTWGEDMEPDFTEGRRCDVQIVPTEELWFTPEVEAEWVACTGEGEGTCEIQRVGDRQMLVCAGASCELTEELMTGVSSFR